MLRILVVDPDPEVPAKVERLFGDKHATRLELCGCSDLAAAFMQATLRPPTAVLIGSALLPLNEEAELAELFARFAPAPVVVLAEPEHALAGGRAINAGARDWVPKDAPLFLALGRIVAHVIEHAQAEHEIARLQQALRTTESLLEELLESAPRAAFILDRDGRIEHCNVAAEQLLYRPRSRIIGHLFSDFLPKHELLCYRDAIERASRPLGRDVMFEVGLITAGEAERFQLHLRAVAVDGWRPLTIIWLQPAAAAGTSDSAATTQLWQLLQDLAATGRSRVPVAQVHLLGLDEVRNLLGDRWPELEHSVHRIVERVLKRFLLPHERYCRDGNKGYVLVFAQASSEQAAERAARIASAIEAAVLGADDLDRRARALVPPLAASERAALARVSTEIREAELTEPGLTLTPETSAGQTRSTAMRPTDSDPLAALERQLREVLRIELEPVYDRAGLPTAIALGRPDPQGNLLLAELRQRVSELPRALLVHDICLLEAMLMALEEEPEPDQLLALTEVHYETLASRRWADCYLARLRQVDPSLRPALGVLITDVAPGTYPPKLGRAVNLLRDFGRLRGLTLPDPLAEPPDPSVVRADLLVLDYTLSERALREAPDAVRNFVRRAHTLHSRVLLRRVPRGLAPSLRERYGFDLTCHA